MTAPQYKALRESIGTPSQVAAMLGVSRMTIHNRETGRQITREAELAIVALAKKKKPYDFCLHESKRGLEEGRNELTQIQNQPRQ